MREDEECIQIFMRNLLQSHNLQNRRGWQDLREVGVCWVVDGDDGFEPCKFCYPSKIVKGGHI